MLTEQVSQLKKQLAKHDERLTWSQDELQQMKHRNAQLDCECNQLKKKLSDLNENVEIMSREYEEKVANLSSELKAAKSLADSNLDMAYERSGNMERLKADLSLRDIQIETLQSQLSGKTADFANLQKFLNEEQKLKEEELIAYEAELDGIKSEMAHAKKTMSVEIERLKGELTRSGEKNRQLKESFESFKSKAELEKKSLLSELLSNLSNLSKKLNDEIRLQSLLVEERNKQEISASNLEKSQRTIGQLKKSHAADKSKLEQEITTLRNEMTALEHARSLAVQQSQTQLADLTTQANSLRDELEARKLVVDERTAIVASVKAKNDELIEQLDQRPAEFIDLSAKLHDSMDTNAQLNERNTQLENSITDRRNEIERLTNDLDAERVRAHESISALESSKSELMSQLTSAIEANQTLITRIASLDSQVSDLTSQLASNQSMTSTLNDLNAKLSDELSARKKDIEMAKEPSSLLLKHVVRCYLRFSDPRAKEALRSCLPDQLKDQTFADCLKEDASTKKWLDQLINNLEPFTPANAA